MFENITLRKWLLESALLFGIPLLGVGISILNNDWTWFSRFGSLMVALSILGLVTHHSLLTTRENHSELQEILNGREPPEIDGLDELHNLDIAKSKALENFEYLFALVNALFGTLIWGFGDLIGKL